MYRPVTNLSPVLYSHAWCSYCTVFGLFKGLRWPTNAVIAKGHFKHIALARACETLVHAACHYDLLGNYPSWGTLAARFSFFSLTGIPLCDTPAIFPSLPVPSWWPESLVQVDEFDRGVNAITFLLAITQKRTLAKMAGLREQYVEYWAGWVSLSFFVTMSKLLAKVRRGKASLDEKDSLGIALVVLLFVSGTRSTFVLRAVRKAFLKLDSRLPWISPLSISQVIDAAESTPFISSLIDVAKYVHTLAEKRRHLRLWAQHWLRKLYSDSRTRPIQAVILATSLSAVNPTPDLQLRCKCESRDVSRPSSQHGGSAADEGEGQSEDQDMDDEGDEGDEGDSDEDPKDPLGIEFAGRMLAAVVAKSSPGLANQQEMDRNLDFMACQDVTDLLSTQPPLSPKTLFACMTRDIIREYPEPLVTCTSASIVRFVESLSDGKSDAEVEKACFMKLVSDYLGFEEN